MLLGESMAAPYLVKVMRTALALSVFVLPHVAVTETVSHEIKQLTATYSPLTPASFGDAKLDASVLLPDFYSKRDNRPAWSDADNADQLFAALNRGVAQGFSPTDFNLPLLYELQDKAQSGRADDIAAFDVVATDAAIKLLHQLFYGKVDPAQLDADWNFEKPVVQRDPADVLNSYIDGLGFDALITEIEINNPQYEQLVTALERYREIAFSGGWPLVPEDTVLKPGMTDPAIPALRERLVREGFDFDATAAATETPEVFDKSLEAAVKAFQTRHGLDADGVVGPRSFVSLNRTAQDRVDQLRLSLERGRWLLRDLEDDFVLVNIAGARTYLVKTDNTIWTTRSITGSAFRKTPVFRDEIQYMEFNPTWTVPASIFRKDKLPRIRKDLGYLDRGNYRVVRTSDRAPVNASSVNWGSDNPGVTLVQQPGPDNALGLVKFMFPNKYAVYLHDTNDRTLFDRNERNLSSGCVRLEYPFEFAELLMEGNAAWSSQKMQDILDSGKTTRVDLDKPIPVLLTYWTAWVEEGRVHFREDPYDRDDQILEALNR